LTPRIVCAWKRCSWQCSALKNNARLGRRQARKDLSDLDGDGDWDRIVALGGQSFSIWNGPLMQSAKWLKENAAEHSVLGGVVHESGMSQA
jgi:hypothetical protein